MRPLAEVGGIDQLAAGVLEREGEVSLTLRGRSMLPLLAPGTPVRIRRVDPDRLRRGDLALYWDGAHLVLHRVLGRGADGPAEHLLFRGDRCARGPLERVSPDQVLGKLAGVWLGGRMRATDSLRWRVKNQTVWRLGRLAARLPDRLRRPLWRLLRPVLGRARAIPAAAPPPSPTPPALRGGDRLSADPALLETQCGESDLLLLDPRTHWLRQLNATAREIWDWCRPGIEWATLERRWSAAYRAAPPEDLRDCVRQLLAAGLLRLEASR